MPLSNIERQRRHRQKLKTGQLIRVDMRLPEDVGNKLDYLAEHWQCLKTEALSRCLLQAWEREGRPIPGFDADGEPLPGNDPAP